ncbi:hypothetical protein [Paludibaculum fermentans]|uniref:Uncharacterized protein n=1 Tax=Paludibaculum fermentans TaxID=1473598 RepID=A0A7S7NPG8_PALFE|nr:hypothetical protein [Paludibaculum fermentans]QOY86879.1 hypothetical protein IRI77_29485 [Paludibaculum fermentans]
MQALLTVLLLFTFIQGLSAQVPLALGAIVGETSVRPGEPYRFRFRAGTKDRITIYANELTTSACFSAKITRGKDELLKQSCSTNNTVVSAFPPPVEDEYVVEIGTTRTGGAAFWLVLACDGPCSAEPPEGAEAGSMEVNRMAPGALPLEGLLESGSRVRRFQFPVVKNGRYQVRLERTDGSGLPRFNLYNPAGKYIPGAETHGSAVYQQTVSASTDGDYQFVMYESGYNSDLPYRVEVNCLLPCSMAPAYEDPTLRSGDVVGVTTIHPEELYSFQFLADQKDRITLYLNDIGVSSINCLTLRAQGGQRVVDNACTSRSPIISDLTLPTTGVYRAEITTTRDGGSTFWLVLGCDGPCGGGVPVGADGKELPSAAVMPLIPLKAGASQKGLLSTAERMLRFNLDTVPSNTYQVKLTRTAGNGLPVFYLYNSVGKYIPGGAGSTVRTQTLVPASSGPHQLVMLESGYNTDLPYKLELVCQSPCLGTEAGAEVTIAPDVIRMEVSEGDGGVVRVPIDITTSVPGTAVQVEVVNAPWVRVSPGAIVAPGQVVVELRDGADYSTVSPDAAIRVTSVSGGASVLVPIELRTPATARESFSVTTEGVQFDVEAKGQKSEIVEVTSESEVPIVVRAISGLPTSVLEVTPAEVALEPGETKAFALTAKGALAQDALRAAVVLSTGTERKLVSVTVIRTGGGDLTVGVAPTSIDLYTSRNFPQTVQVWNSKDDQLRWDATVSSTLFSAEPRFALTLPGAHPNTLEVSLGSTAISNKLLEPVPGSLVFQVQSSQIEVGLMAKPSSPPKLYALEAAAVLSPDNPSKSIQLNSANPRYVACVTLSGTDSWLRANGSAVSGGVALSVQPGKSAPVTFSISEAPPSGTRAFVTVESRHGESCSGEVERMSLEVVYVSGQQGQVF